MHRPFGIAIQELIWRKGTERCERSYKIPALTKEQEQAQAQQAQAQAQAQQAQAQAEQQAQMQAEQHAPHLAPDGFRQANNKREEASAKMNERYLVGQATQNPFMPTNNYVQDIENQMNFLTPQKSS